MPIGTKTAAQLPNPNTDGVITAIYVTLMYTADYRSRRQITVLRKARTTGHNAAKHDGQLVTRFYNVTS